MFGAALQAQVSLDSKLCTSTMIQVDVGLQVCSKWHFYLIWKSKNLRGTWTFDRSFTAAEWHMQQDVEQEVDALCI